jgi:hypothetical protein
MRADVVCADGTGTLVVAPLLLPLPVELPDEELMSEAETC